MVLASEPAENVRAAEPRKLSQRLEVLIVITIVLVRGKETLMPFQKRSTQSASERKQLVMKCVYVLV